MSVEAMAWAFKQALKPPEKVVLLALADHADDDWECHPGQEHLAEKCSLQRTTVSSVIGRLETAGLLRRERRVRENGSRTSDRYLLGPTSAGPTLVKPMSAPGGPNVGATGGPESSENHQEEGVSKETQKNPGPIDEIWELWQSLWADVKGIDPRRRTLEAKTVRIIRNALSLCGEAKVKAAVAGHRNSPHHLGENDRKTVYGDLRYALKGIGNETDQERIEKMARQAPVNGMMAGDTGGLSDERIRTLVDEVEQAIELPGNESIKRRGIEAKARLERAGFRLTRQGTKVRLGR